MKKILSLSLVLIMAAMLFCGSAFAATEQDLFGIWNGSWQYNGKSVSETIVFETNGHYLEAQYVNGEVAYSEAGIYEIEDNTVSLYQIGGQNFVTKYEYTKDSLINNGHAIVKVSPSERPAGSLPGVWNGAWQYNGRDIYETILLEPDGIYILAVYANGELSSQEYGNYAQDVGMNKVFLYILGNKGHIREYDYDGTTLVNNAHYITKTY